MIRGKFIVFEGGEGTGKTTQIKLLVDRLRQQGRTVLLTREPGGTDNQLAEKIRALLKDPANKEMVPETELFLFLASRAQHVQKTILPELEKGTIVISDRYYGSSLAYQHFGRGLFKLEEVKKINDLAINGLEPDLTILLDISPEKGLARIQDRAVNDRLDSETLSFHQKVRNGFKTLAGHSENWKLLSADDSVENIHSRIWDHTKKLLGLVEQNMYSNNFLSEQQGWIEVICGCMFSGKSTEGSKRVAKDLLSKTREVSIFIPREANREVTITDSGIRMETAGKMVARNGQTYRAIEFNKNDPHEIMMIIDSLPKKPTTVVIEEAHFCSLALINVCRELAENYNLRVIVIGLDQTFDDEPFGPIPHLLAEAELITKELAVCVECGSQKANKSWLDSRVRSQLEGKVLVGDDQYIALCRHCKRKYKAKFENTGY